MDNKPIKKSNKKLGKVALTVLLTAGIAIGGAYIFKGCKTNENINSIPESTPIESVLPEEPETSQTPEPIPTPTPEQDITFDELMNKHSDKALAFANENVKTDILDGKTALSETWAFHANSDGEIDSITLTYTYSTSETERIIEVATATFINPVNINEIVNGKAVINNEDYQVTNQTAFVFNAKDFYLNSEVANALNDMLGNDTEINYFKEEDSGKAGVRKFKVAQQSSKALNVFEILVVGTTDEQIIKNLNFSYNYEYKHFATYPIGDKGCVSFTTQEYQLEEFAPENVDEMINDYSTEIISVLDQVLLEKAGKKAFGNSFEREKLLDASWEIDEGEEISEIKFTGTYAKYDDVYLYGVSNIKLENPINLVNLNKENLKNQITQSIENAIITRDYQFTFNPALQGTRDELINSIFEAYGLTKECPEGAVRYFVPHGADVDTILKSEVQCFVVIEIGKEKITEISIRIKNASTDDLLIEKLQNKDNFRVISEISYIIDGKEIEILENNEIIPTKTTTSNNKNNDTESCL